MTEWKKIDAPVSTVTVDRNKFATPTGNLYEALVIVAKRAAQINSDMKRELLEKLEEFATNTETLEEVFENKEQIEVSRYYERLPKPHAIAIQEWLDGKIYYRSTETE
jgi:DNA-directed RNA polymerase subunit K/omega